MRRPANQVYRDNIVPEDDYKNPNDARAHPNSRSGGGGMRRPANQVYRDNIDKGDDKKTVTRQSSTSSNNTSPKKASAPIQKNGDWLPDSRKSVYTATPTLAANTPLNQAP